MVGAPTFVNEVTVLPTTHCQEPHALYLADEIEQRESERRAMDERKFTEEIQILKRTNQQLKTQLESILAPSKK